jgi:hypothetical protein
MATNGPMLFLTVDGEDPGAVLRVAQNGRRRVRVHAEVSSQNPLERLEVLFKGRVIRTARGAGRLEADFDFDVSEAGWFAARAFDKPDHTVRFAHTSPVYVEAAGQTGIVREDVQFFLDWMDREIAFYKELPGFREPEHRTDMLKLFTSAREVYASLLSR